MRERALPLLAVSLAMLLVAPGARATDAEEAPEAPPVADDDGLRLEPAAVPTAVFNSDDGFGTGGVGTLYVHRDGVLPYKAAITVNIYISTRLVQAHRLRLEVLRLFDLPLRVLGQAGYYSTITQNFCGYGNGVTCAPALAAAAAERSGFERTSTEYGQVLRRHHQMRFVRPWAEGVLRYMLWDKPHRFEVWGGWRGNLYIPGEVRVEGFGDGRWFEPGPYPYSQWEMEKPDGEPGFSSALQVGIALDDRDEETQPSSGYFLEASLRGAAFPLGSKWNWAGGNVTLAVYVPLLWGTLTEDADVVLAHRLIFDGVIGDAPTEDFARLGGLTNWFAFGGSDVGRGIREQRYLGKVKAMSQTELRVSLYEHVLLAQRLKWGVAGFVDAAWVGYDVTDWRGDLFRLVGGTGAGLRLLWNDNFAVRWDVAVSPVERWQPRMYIRVSNPF